MQFSIPTSILLLPGVGGSEKVKRELEKKFKGRLEGIEWEEIGVEKIWESIEVVVEKVEGDRFAL